MLNLDYPSLEELLKNYKIEIICANTPQAKRRVVRTNKILQDRLVKELRLHSISTIKEDNGFLPTFTKAYNQRFSKPAKL